jgi:hypothetical protein
MDKNRNFPTTSDVIPSCRIVKVTVERFTREHLFFILCKRDLSWISTAKNRNFPTMTSVRLPIRILATSVKRFMV